MCGIFSALSESIDRIAASSNFDYFVSDLNFGILPYHSATVAGFITVKLLLSVHSFNGWIKYSKCLKSFRKSVNSVLMCDLNLRF